MFEKLKEKISNKLKVVTGSATAVVATVASSVPALASGTDETAAFTGGVTNFMSVVSTMMNTIIGSPILMVFVGGAAAAVAVGLVKRLIGRM